jgi:hypothetical protein
MDVKQGHKDAHLESSFFQETVFLTFPDINDPAVGRGENDVLKVGDFSPRISEKIGDEQREKDSQGHPDLPPHDPKNNRYENHREEEG